MKGIANDDDDDDDVCIYTPPFTWGAFTPALWGMAD